MSSITNALQLLGMVWHKDALGPRLPENAVIHTNVFILIGFNILS